MRRLPRASVRQAARTAGGRAHLATMLATQQTAAEAAQALLAHGVDMPATEREARIIADNIALLQKALGEVLA